MLTRPTTDLYLRSMSPQDAIKTVKSPEWLKKHVRPQAKLLSSNFFGVLYEHLCSQHSGKTLHAVNAFTRRLFDALSTVFETALALKAEIYAAGEEVTYHWYEPGVKCSALCMEVGKRLSGPTTVTDAQRVAVTFLPCLAIQTPAGDKITASPALVKVI